jgi:hypothetical protein
MAVVDKSPFDRHEVTIDPADGNPILRFTAMRYELWFAIHGHGPYQLRICPGEKVREETVNAMNWPEVLQWIARWLASIKRELSAMDRMGAPSTTTPPWALTELPPEYEETVREIDRLQQSERRLRRMAGLLWETGEPLNKLVRDAFREVGFKTELTPDGETYDVTVDLSQGRLLIEVTGLEGNITKASKKIAQVLHARTIARSDDRVGIVVNVYRERAIGERTTLEVASREALELLVGLNAFIVTTPDLFQLWKLARTDASQARQAVEGLRVASAGIVKFGSVDMSNREDR